MIAEGQARKRRKLSTALQRRIPLEEHSAVVSLSCERCQSIDFEALFSIKKLTKDGKPVTILDDLPEDLDATTCPICRLFASVRNKDPKFKKYHLRVFDSIRILAMKRSARVESNNLLAVVPGTMSRKFQKVTNRNLIHHGLISQLEFQSSQQDAVVYSCRAVDPIMIAYPELSRWLKECLGWHQECHCPSSGLIPQMKVIDCDEYRIVPMEAGFDYFTLSYVWGLVSGSVQPSSDAAKSQHLKSGDVPPTIKDAIQVVQKLGYRYLWVDQYCISDAEKRSQIEKMDQIYEGSIATIVAASGDGAESGLPGVSCPRDVDQNVTKVDKIHVSSTLPHISYFLQHSKWRTRAWTYQEAMLSRRIFFFTRAQVYFVCRSTTYCESIQQPSLYSPTGARGNKGMALGPSMFRSDSAMGSRVAKSDFFDQFREYSHRNLTHETDALDAFKGLLARSEFQSYWGIPLYFTAPARQNEQSSSSQRQNSQSRSDLRRSRNRQDTAGFARGLLWICAAYFRAAEGDRDVESQRQREPACPSWSWTSLRHHARYLGAESVLNSASSNPLEQMSSVTEIAVETNDGTLCRFQDLLQSEDYENVHIIPEQSHWIHITGQYIRVVLEQKMHGSANESPSSHKVSQVDTPEIEFPSKKIGSAWIDTDLLLALDGEPDARLVRQTWTAVELYREKAKVLDMRNRDGLDRRSIMNRENGETQAETRSWWMLLDEDEGNYRRVGLMRSWGKVGASWPTRTFRVG